MVPDKFWQKKNKFHPQKDYYTTLIQKQRYISSGWPPSPKKRINDIKGPYVRFFFKLLDYN